MTARLRGVGLSVLAATIAVALCMADAAGASAPPSSTDPSTDPAVQQLADRYAPIVMLKEQENPCDSTGEPFAPMAVDQWMGNPQIALRQLGNGDPTAQRAPTASDLFGLGEGFYLDLPGDALNPGCLYEQDFDRYAARSPATVYAHVVQQADRPDLLAVQYWLFWYYNDWNNLHEGDWEFIQVLFEASTVEEALATEPISVGYAQHEGGERADWNDGKLERDGSRPIVYSSARSHASYFGAAVYMGRSGAEGFGCDNTDSPSIRVDPDVVVLPDRVTDASDPLAWVEYRGRWGERQRSPNNGPTGPITKPRWTAPIDWLDDLRDSAYVVPTGDSQPAAIIGTFCSVVEWGSVKFIEFRSSPGQVAIGLVVLVLLVRFIIRRTSWRSVAPLPVVHRRRAGQIVRASLVHYARHPRQFVGVGVVYLPLVFIAGLLASTARRLPAVGDLVAFLDTDGSGSRAVLSALIGGVVTFMGFVLVVAAVAHVLGQQTQGVDPRARDAIRAVLRRAGDLGSGFLRALVLAVLLSLTVVGFPLAVWVVVRYQFMAQVVMLERLDGRQALARSARLVRGRWLHTAVITALVNFVVGTTGLVIGVLLLVAFTELPLWALSVIVTLVNVLIMPLGAIVVTLLYGDAVAERDEKAQAAESVDLVEV